MIRLALRVRREHAELVLAELLELAPAGVEELELDGEPGREGVVEYAVYGAPGELPDLPQLRAAAGGSLVEVSTSEVPDDWSESWKRFHSPVLIEAPAATVPSLHVRPPWEDASARPGALELVIDPAQAFGTGGHATTRLCLELLLELAASEPERGPLLDVGAGSGVLAIAGAKLGHRPVLALDNDRESILAIAENATVNDVEIEVRRFDLRREALPAWDGLDGGVILANLLRPLLLSLSETMSVAPRHLIASGLLREEANEVAGAFSERLGLRERERREQGDWAALWLAAASA